MTDSRRDWLAARGLLFPLLGARNPKPLARVVTRGTDVCLEGYPRSANSYAVRAFRIWNPGARIAHHLHTPMQILRAARLGVPCAVLIRSPLDAVASVLVMDRGRISDTAAYRSYLHFYSRALSVRDRVAVAPFEEVARDPTTVVTRLNATFGTHFVAEPVDAEAEAWFMEQIERSARERGLPATVAPAPSAEKERLKADVRERLAAHPLLAEARQLHARWVDPGRASGS